MILRGIDVYSSQDEESDNRSEEISAPKGEDAYPCNEYLLVLRRTLHKQSSPQDQT